MRERWSSPGSCTEMYSFTMNCLKQFGESSLLEAADKALKEFYAALDEVKAEQPQVSGEAN